MGGFSAHVGITALLSGLVVSPPVAAQAPSTYANPVSADTSAATGQGLRR
ncbi:hypothetical protein [Nonomuraea sp. NEAU-A123]|nr:hypothetical protein [Nonomuraea sp. NEAU-A123]MBT2227944.1 hypothetical protein [Nonomuraea sp. NEAU-A123]